MEQFWNVIFPEGETGYVAIALKRTKPTPNQKSFELKYIDLAQRKKLYSLVKSKDQGDLYFCPSILKEPYLCKANVKYSYVIWTDQDASSNGVQLPSPGLVVASGTAGHTHVYWPLSEPLTRSDVELRTRGLAQSSHADPSGIDATQLLRVPGTLNHKTKIPTEVKLISTTKVQYKPDEFTCVAADYYDHLFTALDPLQIISNVTSDRIKSLLFQEVSDVGDRSEALMHFAHTCAEAGLSDDERYTLLIEADSRWGKFSQRDDRDLRLGEIVVRSAKEEVTFDLNSPDNPGGAVENKSPIKLLGWRSISHESRQITWVINGLLRTRGLMFFAASSGVGKSTAAMNLAASLILKESWLGFTIQEENQKILYESPEMDEQEINYFLSHMNQVLPVESQELLEQSIFFDPIGMPVYLNTKEGQKYYEDRIQLCEPTGLIIDTLGASVSTSLIDEKEMRIIADWIDVIRQKYGIWVLVLHHYRKAGQQNRNVERTLDDMYGAQLIANRANTALGFRQFPKTDNILEITSLKGRFQANGQGSHLFVRRTSSLWLEKDVSFVPKVRGKESEDSVDFDLVDEKDLPI